MNVWRVPGLLIAGVGLILFGAATALLTAPAANAPASDVVPARVSYPAPQLRLADLDGRPSSLADYAGQVMLVNLWATWCPPCKEEMPALQAYFDLHKDEGFTIIAINDGESHAAVARFIEQYRLTLPVWLDPAYLATEQAFRTLNLPSSFVIDRGGTVRLRWVGGVDLQTLERHVSPIILE